MPAQQAASNTITIWDLPEPASRPAPGPLSREQIERAALTIGDTEGLSAVTLRRVGAFLNAGPMRLYRYLSTKEELLELMIDAVYREMVSAGPVSGEWREALQLVAHRMRQAASDHSWFVDLLGGRPHQGPSALAHLESSLAALSGTPGFADIDVALQALKTVNAYVIGALQSEASERRAARESGLQKQEWQKTMAPYILRMIATGRFPMIAKLVEEATHPSPDVVFEDGLACLLDGIAVRLALSSVK